MCQAFDRLEAIDPIVRGLRFALPWPQAEDALQMLIRIAADFKLPDLLEMQYLRIELDRAIEIGNRHSYGVYAGGVA